MLPLPHISGYPHARLLVISSFLYSLRQRMSEEKGKRGKTESSSIVSAAILARQVPLQGIQGRFFDSPHVNTGRKEEGVSGQRESRRGYNMSQGFLLSCFLSLAGSRCFLPQTLIVLKTSKPFKAVDMTSPGICGCQCSSFTSLDPWWMKRSCGGSLSTS